MKNKTGKRIMAATLTAAIVAGTMAIGSASAFAAPADWSQRGNYYKNKYVTAGQSFAEQYKSIALDYKDKYTDVAQDYKDHYTDVAQDYKDHYTDVAQGWVDWAKEIAGRYSR